MSAKETFNCSYFKLHSTGINKGIRNKKNYIYVKRRKQNTLQVENGEWRTENGVGGECVQIIPKNDVIEGISKKEAAH